MTDVFLSYASPDRAKARQLAQKLSGLGISVFWDRDILPGQTFDEVIEEQLNGAACVVVLWSKASVASDWVKTEAAEAAVRKALIPALIEDVKPPLEFRRIQAASLIAWRGEAHHPSFGILVAAVAAKLGRALGEPPSELATDREIVRPGAERPSEGIVAPAGRALSAYASYASEDRMRVLDRVASLSAIAGIDVFLDSLSLHPGEQWKPRIAAEIAARDVFLLFWSSHARASPWVEWEWRTALELKGLVGIQVQALEPVSSAPPPVELSDIHFGDVFSLARSAHERRERG